MSASEGPWHADELWGRIRRGCCVGEETFRGELEGMLAGAMKGRRRESYIWEIARRHDEVEAASPSVLIKIIKLTSAALGLILIQEMLPNGLIV